MVEYLPVIIDVGIIVFIAISFFTGRARGFAALVISLAVTIAFLCFARTFAPKFAQYMNDNYVHDKLTESIDEKLTDIVKDGAADIKEALPSYLTDAAEKAGIDTESPIPEESITAASESIAEKAESVALIPLMTALGYVLAYVFARLFSTIFSGLTDAIFKLPGLKQVNQGLGALAGTIFGVVTVLVFVAILAAATKMVPESGLTEILPKARIFTFINDKIISSII